MLRLVTFNQQYYSLKDDKHSNKTFPSNKVMVLLMDKEPSPTVNISVNVCMSTDIAS